MNPYPQDKSILILDNCAIHKTRALREIVEGSGQVLLFLPPYSPDFNPIEESFSCGMSLYIVCIQTVAHIFAVKHWIRKNWHKLQVAEYPEVTLLESSAAVTAEKSRGWFVHSGYIVV
jgi:transposase